MMFFTSVAFAVIFALARVHADNNDEAVQACNKVFEPGSFKCCETLSNLMMNETDYKDECGLEKGKDWTCEKSECLLKKKGFMENGEIDHQKASALLQEVVESHPETKPMVDSILKNCNKGNYDAELPDDMCDAWKYHTCTISMSMIECPNWKQDDECQSVAKDIAKCKAILPKD